MKRIGAQKLEKYENATQCYICRHTFEDNDSKKLKNRDHDHITRFVFGAALRQCNLERRIGFELQSYFTSFVDAMRIWSSTQSARDLTAKSK